MTTTESTPARSGPFEDQGSGSLGQCLLWLMESQYGGPGIMNVPIIYRMRGKLDVGALRAALTSLTERHESLRTTFDWDPERRAGLPAALERRVRSAGPVDVEAVDVSDAENPYEAAYTHIHDRLVRNIDVLTGPPFTVDLFRLRDDDHLLMLNVHHIVTDAWSNMLLCRDLGEFYNRQLGAPPNELEPVEWSFGRYIEWQQERLAGKPGEAHTEFWREKFTTLKYLDLRPMPEREADRKPPCENVWFVVEGPQMGRLRELAAQERTTLYTVMLALFYCVLHVVSGEQELTVGSVFANRPRRELYNTVGFFANLVVLGAELPPEPSFTDVLRVVRRTVLEVLAHHEYPFLNALIDPVMSPTAYRGHEVVFHMLAVPEHVAPPSGIAFSGLEVEPHPIPDGMGSRFDLELLIIPQVGMLEGVYRYASDRYEREFIERLARIYQDLVNAVVDNPTVSIAKLRAAQPEDGAE